MPDDSPSVTPMLAQYRSIKSEVPDAILFYRMGDFYELFFEDAEKAAPLLEVQLTSRDKNAKNPISMCGVPHHAVMGYAQKLLGKGYKVALCDQIEDPATTKGLVKRAVTRILTPALIADPEWVSERSSPLLFACATSDAGYWVGILDLLASDLRVGLFSKTEEVIDCCAKHGPSEFLFCGEGALETELMVRFPSVLVTHRVHKTVNEELELKAWIAEYVRETQRLSQLPSIKTTELVGDHTLRMDRTSLDALEIFDSRTGDENASVLWVLDRTSTSMGFRRLKQWLAEPLADRSAIEERHQAVEGLLRTPSVQDGLKKLLASLRDLERLSTKVALKLAGPRDLVAIRESLKALPEIIELIAHLGASRLKAIARELDPLEALVGRLDRALEDQPALGMREGGIFRSSYHAEIAEYRSLSLHAKDQIASMEQRERERTGISSLKIRFSRVFGYTFEVTTPHLSKVPENYRRRQTMANGERFVSDELKHFEEKALSAEQRLRSIEEALFLELRDQVTSVSEVLSADARLLSELDVLLSFALVARDRGYVRPELREDWRLSIEEGRHPVVEALLPRGTFVSNSLGFDDESRSWLITGPNMAGKSTIMRQTALIAFLAQVGSFVPARSASLPVLDAIYTRIGSSDDVAHGRSTFMVEMTEVARILEAATSRSLILIDEIGRGTSTYDGLALAWALLEYIHLQIGAKTLFATHFHELTALEKTLRGLKNACVKVERWNDEMVFLHQLSLGVSHRSFGVEVARLAGVPHSVIDRARGLLKSLEADAGRVSAIKNRVLQEGSSQLVFFDELASSAEPRPERIS